MPLIQHDPADPRIHPSVFNGKTPCSGTKYTSNNGASLPPPAPLPPPPPAKVVVAYGTGSGFHALRHSPPSPTTGLRKRLCAKAHQGLVVIDTPEYLSSKKCSRCKRTQCIKIHHGHECKYKVVTLTKKSKYGYQRWFHCGASAAATALLAEVTVAGIVITTLPSTSGPI